MKIGDHVAIMALGIVGTVSEVNPVLGNIEPCPCCQPGRVVVPAGGASSLYLVPPSACVRVCWPAMVVRGGRA